MKKNIPQLDWGGFALIEYLLSKRHFAKNFKVLDIGGSLGHHSSIMRSFGLSVDLIDKYEKKAEFQADFNKFNFKKKYDMVFCSHVIEHQRNQGAFLDKIYDILKDNGDLLISGPNHPAEHFVEGHISTTILPVFLQLLIYAGFDCKNGKLMSLGGIENSFIVKKAKNYTKDERDETGYKWTDKHQDRAPFKLVDGTSIPRIQLALNNCDIFRACEKDSKLGLSFTPPKNYKNKNIKFHLNMWRHFSLLDSDLNFLYSVTPGSPIKKEYLLLEI